MSDIARQIETDLDAVLGNRRGPSLVDIRAIANAEQIGDDDVLLGGLEIGPRPPPPALPAEINGSIEQIGSDCYIMFMHYRQDTFTLSMEDGLKYTCETLYPENHEEVYIAASKHLLHYGNVRDQVAIKKAARIAARHDVINDLLSELIRDRIEKEFVKAKRASAKATKTQIACFLAAKASDMCDVVLYNVMAAVDAKASAEAKARRAAEAKAKADAAKEAERKARHDERVRVKKEKADAKARAEAEAVRKAEEAALEYMRVTEQKKTAKPLPEKRPLTKHEKKVAEQKIIAERALAIADKLSDRSDDWKRKERAEREKHTEREERERKERAEREKRAEREAIKQVKEFERLEAERLEAERLKAERLEAKTCGVCFKPYGTGMQQAMARKCGDGPECSMCLECLLGIAHSKGTRCLCGRDNLDVRQWRTK